ncbi:MAG: ABC transporter ATP-binding protein [bacterium]|nr:ABC transporter ATP-binding protein [bacterium]
MTATGTSLESAGGGVAGSTETIVAVDELSVRYHGATVLQKISFNLQAGDFAIFVGPNGGGKTTLFRALLGLIDIDHGGIQICGATPAQARTAIGYVPQRNVYDPRFPLRVAELVAMGCLGPGMRRLYDRSEEKRRVDEALDAVGMLGRARAPIRELSGGQLQRAFIARGLVSAPRLLILDEPVTHLDARITASFYRLLRRLQERGLTILMSTHDAGAAAQAGDRLFEISGRLREQLIGSGSGETHNA